MKDREDLPNFLNENNLMGIGVEVGVLKGEFSSHILKNWNGNKLYLVDSWRHISGLNDFNNPDHNGHLDNLANTFMNIYEFNERAILIRDYSVSASRLFQDNSLDFVYIDAAHDFDGVLTDLKAWWPKIKVGGLMAGDDYVEGYTTGDRTMTVEVIKATNEFFGEDKVSVTPEKSEDPYYKPNWWIFKE